MLCKPFRSLSGEREAGFSLTVPPFRRPTPEPMPTLAKAARLDSDSARAIREAVSRGFDKAAVRDAVGNVAETGASNVVLAGDGAAMTPVPNGSLPDGITRRRVIALLRADGVEVVERSLTPAGFTRADEIFSSGNHSKIVPVTRFEARAVPVGPACERARALSGRFARETGKSASSAALAEARG